MESFHKSLPRLPSSDDAYEDIGLPITPKPVRTHQAPPVPVSTPLSPSIAESSRPYFLMTPTKSSGSSSSSASLTPKPFTKDDPNQLLSSLRHTFQRTEQSLYGQLSHTAGTSLNDVRRSFLSAAKGAHRRMIAWQKKHLPAASKSHMKEALSFDEPEWWGKGCHAVPGGNIIVREDDWGSIIAHTMR